VHKYQSLIVNLAYHNTANRNDVEDVAQQVFAKVYFSIGTFDNRRPFFPWLYRIAINQCYDELRRARRRRLLTFSELSLEDADAIAALAHYADPAPNPGAADPERLRLLHALLDQLPAPQRMVLVLRDLQDVSYEEMARILECSEQAARLKVFRARRRLCRSVERALRHRGRSR